MIDSENETETMRDSSNDARVNTEHESASATDPVIKFENDSGIGGAVIAYVAFVACLYAVSVALSNSILSFVSILLLIAGVIAYFIVKRRMSSMNENETKKKIESSVSSYEDDLRETMFRYGIDYTDNDIRKASDEYRDRLEIENASIADIDLTGMARVIGIRKDRSNYPNQRNRIKDNDTSSAFSNRMRRKEETDTKIAERSREHDSKGM